MLPACRGRCGKTARPRIPGSRGRSPEWCSETCRQRAWREKNPEKAEQQRVTQIARHGEKWREKHPDIECPFCGEVRMRPGRARSCGAKKCRDARNAQRSREQRARFREQHGKAITTGRYDEKRRGYSDVRRARLAEVEVEEFDRREVFDRDGWVCGICHEPVDSELRHPDLMSVSLDHVIPISQGGPHTRENTRCSHYICNVRRSDRLEAA